MDAPPVHLSEPLSVDVLPAPPTTRRTPFRRSRSNQPGVLDRPVVVTGPDVAAKPAVVTDHPVVTHQPVVTGPAMGNGPADPNGTPAATQLLVRERDEARARVAELERQLDLLNREVAFAKDEPSLVWVARGDACYHRRRRCAGLVAQPAAIGGTSLQLAHVPRAQALDSGLHRCQLCC
jgi:hypothetical protein